MSRTLTPEELRAACDAAALGFTTTAELDPPERLIGQDRALSATAFGIGLKAPGYNLFVSGPQATGKQSAMKAIVGAAAASEPVPPDDCYVHDFEDPYRPKTLRLPSGRGRELRDAMARLVADAPARMAAAFEGEEFEKRGRELVDVLQKSEKEKLRRLEEQAKAEGFKVVTAEGEITVVYAPTGEGLSPEEFDALPAEERDRIDERARTLSEQVEPLVRELRQLGRDADADRKRLVDETARAVADALLAPVRARFEGLEGVPAFLTAVEKDLVEHGTAFLPLDTVNDDDNNGDAAASAAAEDEVERLPPPHRFLRRYRVNVLVARDGERGAPVVVEPSPTPKNLVGRLEHRAHMGTLVTDHTLIKAGALHNANGGYLLLEARDVLEEPAAWTLLKKALKSGRIRIEEPDEEAHAITALMLQPQPVPLDVKVVLVGPRELYEYVYAADDEFRELFKVRVDFDDSLDRSPDAERLFGRFVAGACRDMKLRPFDAAAVARLVEHAARLVEHQARLSARFGELGDVLREADHVAGARGAGVVGAADVQAAIEHRRRRSSLLEERLHRLTEEDTLIIATAGAAVGQVNGLEVLATGDYEFGRPFRITARARPGKPGVVDVEREVGLGGAIHAKGVLILSGYLGGHYLIDRPLAMSASIVAEQSYDPMEGDSASLAEVCALLSALARRPLAQHLAVSGSINQHGQVQAVGGINEKIEGFFDLCVERGLTGIEGVIVPQANVRHLMLRHDVVEAARAGRFRVLAVATVDEAIGALTGAAAGARGDDGHFPEGTFNAAVEQRLAEFAAAVERHR